MNKVHTAYIVMYLLFIRNIYISNSFLNLVNKFELSSNYDIDVLTLLIFITIVKYYKITQVFIQNPSYPQ